ncbi:MAG: OmpH family outer membrane protein [Ignavibacteriales bacterium]|nr:OmpH family outer membrane protein [Ignavibacteriales bacterium]
MKHSAIVRGIAVLTAIIGLALVAQPVSAQVKLGYVNSETILKELPEAKEAQQKLETIVKGWQDELEKMSKDLQAKYEDYQKKSAMWTEAAKQAEQKKLIDQEQKVNQYRTDKFGQQGELAMQREKMMTPIREKILRTIEVVAKDQQVSFMFDKAGDVLLLYADKSADYTYEVLNRLIKDLKSEAKPAKPAGKK